MAKNFPYFKFVATEWLTGDIVFEDYELQGLFINICALYWHRDGNLNLTEIEKRLKNKRVSDLKDTFFNVDENGLISIKFLDEQLITANHISKINSENGKKGAEVKRNKANAKRTLSERKANFSKEEKEKEKESKIYAHEIINANPNIPYDKIREYVNTMLGTKHTPYNKNVQLQITQLYANGIKSEDINRVVLNTKNDEWHKNNNYRSCAPDKMFTQEYFDRFNTPVVKEEKPKIRAPWD